MTAQELQLRYDAALGRLAISMNGLTPRELHAYRQGQRDGIEIKADADQIIVSRLEEENQRLTNFGTN